MDVIALVFTSLPMWAQVALFIAFLLIGGMTALVAVVNALEALWKLLRPPSTHPPSGCPFQRELEIRQQRLLRQQAKSKRDRFRAM